MKKRKIGFILAAILLVSPIIQGKIITVNAAEEVNLSNVKVGTTKAILTSTSNTKDYALFNEAGEQLSPWTSGKEGKVEFSNLSEATKYILKVRDANNVSDISNGKTIKTDDSSAYPMNIKNGSFESPVAPTTTYFVKDNTKDLYWKTTAYDRTIELVSTKNSSVVQGGYYTTTAADGTQFAELNANVVSTLYQDIKTVPGSTMKWSLNHRGRWGTDSMKLMIGSPIEDLKDQIPDGQSAPNMITSNTAWKEYTGSYVVPEGQTVTRFAFVSVSAAGNNNSVGNLLDKIRFTIKPPTPSPVPSKDISVDNNSIIISPTQPGYEYSAFEKDTNKQVKDWTTGEDNKVVFDDLKTDTTYEVKRRTAGSEEQTSSDASKGIDIYVGKEKQYINIPDANLKAVILSKLGQSADYKITKDDMESLVSLNISNKDIKNLEGLQYCANLKWLSLEGNTIDDFTPISSLTALKYLYMKNTNIKNLNCLSSLTNLNFLNLFGNDLEDLSGISNLKELRTLSLANNNISDVSDLSGLSHLNYLNLYGNRITDISPLKSLELLAEVNLMAQNIILDEVTTGPIYRLENPIKDLKGNSVTGISDITHNGHYNKRTNNVQWARLKKDSNLGFNFSKDVNFKHITTKFSGSVHQKTKFVKDNSLIPDKTLREGILKRLNKSSDYQLTIKDLQSLTRLIIENADVENLEGLQYCTNLQALNLRNNKVSDLTPLAKLTNLTFLNVFGNEVFDITPIANLTNLETLSLANNELTDINTVTKLKNLSYINVYGNRLSDLSPIDSLSVNCEVIKNHQRL